MKIHLPNSAFLGNIDPFLKKISLLEPNKLEITANKKWISIHPVVLCMVAALGMNIKPSKIACEKLEAKSKHYLQRMGLFRLLNLGVDHNIVEHEPAGRFIPLTKITNSDELTTFITEMVPLLHLDPAKSDSIKYVVSELVRNVIEHSQSKEGALVSAQYYKKSNTIRLGIVDTGVGIKKTINNAYPAETHIEAIKLALTPGITGTTQRIGGTEYNAGAGLFFIKSIAQINREFFMIYSGNAMYKLLKSSSDKTRIILHSDPFLDRHSKGEDYPCWHGTVVGVDISLSKTEEFSTLLDLIRDVYIKTIKERRKEQYRKPRFI
ncbi:sensor histidine kinase [Candidatus Woesearchaeota archaeon]|nr:sensor histidine kinase [Candidatus Woesearchaeota archaeon]